MIPSFLLEGLSFLLSFVLQTANHYSMRNEYNWFGFKSDFFVCLFYHAQVNWFLGREMRERATSSIR